MIECAVFLHQDDDAFDIGDGAGAIVELRWKTLPNRRASRTFGGL
jgi:hypothetical protein